MSIVEWTQNSLDFLDKLDKKDSERIVKKIDEIKESPIRFIRGDIWADEAQNNSCTIKIEQ